MPSDLEALFCATMERLSAREAEDDCIHVDTRWLSLAKLQELRSAASADNVPIDLGRMRYWSPAVARDFFETGELPAHWKAVCISIQDEADPDEARDEALHILEPHAQSAAYEHRDNAVCIAATSCQAPEAFRFLEPLGECGDSRCGCHRLTSPDVRDSFVDLVIEHTVKALMASAYSASSKPTGVRYVTLGCGQLLTDAQILVGLLRAGLTIESVVAVDADFYGACASGGRSTAEEPRVQRALDAMSCKPARALEALVRLLGGHSTAFALCGVASLVDACHRDSSRFGNVTTFVQCDSSVILEGATKLAAASTLRPGGLAFALQNYGHQQDATPASSDHPTPNTVTTIVWERTASDGDDGEPLKQILSSTVAHRTIKLTPPPDGAAATQSTAVVKGETMTLAQKVAAIREEFALDSSLNIAGVIAAANARMSLIAEGSLPAQASKLMAVICDRAGQVIDQYAKDAS